MKYPSFHSQDAPRVRCRYIEFEGYIQRVFCVDNGKIRCRYIEFEGYIQQSIGKEEKNKGVDTSNLKGTYNAYHDLALFSEGVDTSNLKGTYNISPNIPIFAEGVDTSSLKGAYNEIILFSTFGY